MRWNQTEIRFRELSIALGIKLPVPRSSFLVSRSLIPVPRVCDIIANKIYVGILDKETLIAPLKALSYKNKPTISQRYEDHI